MTPLAFPTPRLSGSGRTAQKLKELEAAIRSITPMRGSGVRLRRTPWGTTYSAKPGASQTMQGGTDTWA